MRVLPCCIVGGALTGVYGGRRKLMAPWRSVCSCLSRAQLRRYCGIPAVVWPVRWWQGWLMRPESVGRRCWQKRHKGNTLKKACITFYYTTMSVRPSLRQFAGLLTTQSLRPDIRIDDASISGIPSKRPSCAIPAETHRGGIAFTRTVVAVNAATEGAGVVQVHSAQY